MTLVITGANGNLGQRLVRALLRDGGVDAVRAVVRREAAASLLETDHPGLDVRIVDYLDQGAMADVLAGAASVVHLVGIIKQSANSRYEVAHEQTSQTLAQAAAAAGVRRLVSLSIVGSTPDSSNACLSSKGRADAMLLACPVPATVIRVPMVLGEGDYASYALKRRASSGFNIVFRAASLEQPIYAGDVVEAIRRLIDAARFENRTLELAGPEALTRRELTERAAACLGRTTRVLSLPIGAGMAIARVLEWLPNPPITRAMLGVLDHDDRVDAHSAARALSLSLTPLEDMLNRCLADADIRE
ncbi:MAG: NAD(P)H-binding protein [Gammaproteobacteria bacterium]|nr:NAD(P)H-binding protein [Gammaproteobacteria bacterium]